jgi:AcrR family transcriptional regulator
MSPKIINKREKQLNVIQAAIPIFAKNGFYNTKMSDIAVDADVGKGSLYEYFDNKDDLFFKTFELWFQLFQEQIEDIKGTRASANEKIIKIFESFFKNIEQYSSSYYIYFDFWSELVRNKNYSEQLAQVYDGLRNSIIEVVDEIAIAKQVDSITFASLIIAAAEGIMIQWLVDKEIFDIQKTGKLAIEALIS